MGVSIGTVNLNNKLGLFKTIESVLMQNSKIWKHLIVDAKSGDMDVNDWLNIEGKGISYISEKDGGVYDGMNKGARFTNENYLFFLNSGDCLASPDSLDLFKLYLDKYDLIYGNVDMIKGTSSIFFPYPSELSLDYMILYGLPHQGILIKRTLHNQIGGYSSQYKIISDWVFFMEALFFHNATYKHIDSTVSFFDGSGMSQNHENTKLIISEQLDYITQRFPSYVRYYKLNSPYVKKHFRRIPRWQRFFKRFLFNQFNKI